MPGRNAFSNNSTTVAQDLVVAQKRQQNRNWERSNPARRYLISVDVRDEVAALAEALMENVDPVACVLFDYCVDLIFLRRVGGGYIFVHRLLMEHFAAMYQEE